MKLGDRVKAGALLARLDPQDLRLAEASARANVEAARLAMIPLTRSVFWGPMAVAVMGGLIGGTVLTLTFLPALYAAWFRVKPAGAESKAEADETPDRAPLAAAPLPVAPPLPVAAE